MDAITPKVPLAKVGELYVEGVGRLSAGSGMVTVGDRLFVVADDDLYVGSFPSDLSTSGRAVPLFTDAPLPADHDERKAAKPDLECLARVPASVSGLPGDALLMLGSGSTEQRRRGVLLPLEPDGAPLVFRLDPLYDALAARISNLNIEGGAVTPDVVRLLHRGNSQGGVNAVIDLDPRVFFAAIRDGATVGADALREIRPVDLGSVPSPAGPVPLAFTDLATSTKGDFVFTAAAERTPKPFDDGPVLASVLGRMSADGTVREMRLIDTAVKIEGVDVSPSDDGSWRVRLVSDPDDPSRPADVFQVAEEPGWLLH